MYLGIRIVDQINSILRQSYFKIEITEEKNYLPKQSTSYLLSKEILKLSSNRLSRVMQQTIRSNRCETFLSLRFVLDDFDAWKKIILYILQTQCKRFHAS